MKAYVLKNIFPLPSVKVKIGYVVDIEKELFEAYIETGAVRPAISKDKDAPTVDLKVAESDVKEAEEVVKKKGKGMLKGIVNA